MILGVVKKMTVELIDGSVHEYEGHGILEKIDTYIEGETKSVKDRRPAVSYHASVGGKS